MKNCILLTALRLLKVWKGFGLSFSVLKSAFWWFTSVVSMTYC